MIYGCGLIEKNRLRKEKKESQEVFRAWIVPREAFEASGEGSYRLLITANSRKIALSEIGGWLLSHRGDVLGTLIQVDIDRDI